MTVELRLLSAFKKRLVNDHRLRRRGGAGTRRMVLGFDAEARDYGNGA